ncbi:MAG: superinfection immunity protein [Deltaproteobacteria bacterium]|nr:superinfection immunity protein [Deltaproteobacteria bacterium]
MENLGAVLGVGIVGLLILGLIALAIYVLPSIIAFLREHPYAFPICAINILLGWSIIGYVAALVWAVWPLHRRYDRYNGRFLNGPF